MNVKKITIIAVSVLSLGGFASLVSANHSWGGYHWARTANPFTLELGDNVSAAWDGYLATTANDWSVSSVLDAVIKPGKTASRTCKATTGRVEVCNNKYGSTGWLGVAQVWINGTHIVKGTVKVNDTYFATKTYNTPAWKNLVMCQEIGHTLGLDHQDEGFTNLNLGTCMDYTNDPSTNQHPNQHDYDMLETIYAHLDSTNTVFASTSGGSQKGKVQIQNGEDKEIDFDNPSEWGKVIKKDDRGLRSLHMRDLGNGEKVFTFVISVQ